MDSDAENELWKLAIKAENASRGNSKEKARIIKHHKELRKKGGAKQMTLKNTTDTKHKTATKAPEKRRREREQTEEGAEEEDADATTEEQATQRKTGEGNAGFLFFSQKGARTHPQKEQGDGQLCAKKEEARGGGKRQKACGEEQPETN